MSGTPDVVIIGPGPAGYTAAPDRGPGPTGSVRRFRQQVGSGACPGGPTGHAQV